VFLAHLVDIHRRIGCQPIGTGDGAPGVHAIHGHAIAARGVVEQLSGLFEVPGVVGVQGVGVVQHVLVDVLFPGLFRRCDFVLVHGHHHLQGASLVERAGVGGHVGRLLSRGHVRTGHGGGGGVVCRCVVGHVVPA